MSEALSADTPTLNELAAEVRRLRERVDDLEDLRDLNDAIERNAGKPGTPWQEVCREFGWDFGQEPEPKSARAGD
jgi:hypothetical protein